MLLLGIGNDGEGGALGHLIFVGKERSRGSIVLRTRFQTFKSIVKISSEQDLSLIGSGVINENKYQVKVN